MLKELYRKWRLLVAKYYYKWPVYRPFFKAGIKKTVRDKRSYQWYKDRLAYGVDERATWGLSGDAVKWFTPRLKMYKLCTPFYPHEVESLEEWHEMLDDMIFFLEYEKDYGAWNQARRERRDGTVEVYDKALYVRLHAEEARANEGRKLLIRYFWSFGW